MQRVIPLSITVRLRPKHDPNTARSGFWASKRTDVLEHADNESRDSSVPSEVDPKRGTYGGFLQRSNNKGDLKKGQWALSVALPDGASVDPPVLVAESYKDRRSPAETSTKDTFAGRRNGAEDDVEAEFGCKSKGCGSALPWASCSAALTRKRPPDLSPRTRQNHFGDHQATSGIRARRGNPQPRGLAT